MGAVEEGLMVEDEVHLSPRRGAFALKSSGSTYEDHTCTSCREALVGP
jgi:hypothetical protein